jgi:hypothetical protein
MKKYIITYHSPLRYKGTYLVEGEDGIAASKKLQNHLEQKYGYEDNSNSTVMEVYENILILI